VRVDFSIANNALHKLLNERDQLCAELGVSALEIIGPENTQEAAKRERNLVERSKATSAFIHGVAPD
jgi:hypothetical protein